MMTNYSSASMTMMTKISTILAHPIIYHHLQHTNISLIKKGGKQNMGIHIPNPYTIILIYA